jgi:hypothetical protein
MNFKTMSLFVPMMSLAYSGAAFAMEGTDVEKRQLTVAAQGLAVEAEQLRANSMRLGDAMAESNLESTRLHDSIGGFAAANERLSNFLNSPEGRERIRERLAAARERGAANN